MEVPEELARFLPIRLVFRRDAEGRLLGLTEESWNMNRSRERVRVWWSGKAYSIFGEHTINGVDDSLYNCKYGDFVVDPLAEDSPVEVNWQYWLTAMTAGERRKYDSRNAPFSVKEESCAP